MTLNEQILQFLSDKDWVFGGTLERAFLDYKPSNVSRRLRELYSGFTEKGHWGGKYLDRRLVQVDGKGAYVVQYKLLEHPEIEWTPYLVEQEAML